MRTAVIILVILGTLASLGLGIKWLSDFNDYKSQIESVSNISSAELADALKELETTRNCAYALIICGVIALISVFLIGKKGKIMAGIILVSGIVPAIIEPIAIVFTSFLVLGGILAFFIKPKVITA